MQHSLNDLSQKLRNLAYNKEEVDGAWPEITDMEHADCRNQSAYLLKYYLIADLSII